MALGGAYAELAELKERLDIDDNEEDAALELALQASSRGIEQHCRRQFNQADAATARLFVPTSAELALADDFHTTTGLVVETDTGADGVFDTIWDSGDYQLEPLGGVADGIEGWPYWRLRATASRFFPCSKRRATLRVTAQWGWQAVPEPVKEATLILAAETFKLREAPFGVAGFGEYGVVKVRDNHKAQMLLAPFRRSAVRVA